MHSNGIDLEVYLNAAGNVRVREKGTGREISEVTRVEVRGEWDGRQQVTVTFLPSGPDGRPHLFNEGDA